MANWCSAIVEFRGDKKAIGILNKLFDKTIEMADKTNEGQILFGLEGAIDGYMFNIYKLDEEEDYMQIQFETKWNPIPHDIVRIAETFNLTFSYDFEESGNNIYGKYNFDGENLTLQSPTDAEIEECRYKLDDDWDETEEDYYNGFDYDKLEDFMKYAVKETIQIFRVNEKDMHT